MSTHLHRANDPSSAHQTYARFQYPFAEFPTLRSHVQPHLVIFNLCDKLKSDSNASVHLALLHPDKEIRASALDMLELHQCWLGAHPRRAAGFYFNKLEATLPGFCYEDVDDSEDVAHWDAPRARIRKPEVKPRSEDYLAQMDSSDDESLDTLDSGYVEHIDWWLSPSSVDRLWMEDIRQWQASSATGAYDYNAPWEEPYVSPVFEVGAYLLVASTRLSDSLTQQDDETLFDFSRGYLSD